MSTDLASPSFALSEARLEALSLHGSAIEAMLRPQDEPVSGSGVEPTIPRWRIRVGKLRHLRRLWLSESREQALPPSHFAHEP